MEFFPRSRQFVWGIHRSNYMTFMWRQPKECGTKQFADKRVIAIRTLISLSELPLSLFC